MKVSCVIKGLVFMGCVLFMGSNFAGAVEKISFSGTNWWMEQQQIFDSWDSSEDKAKVIGLAEENEMIVYRTGGFKEDGVVFTKYQQYYQDIPVFGAKIVFVNRKGENIMLRGNVYKDLEMDKEELSPVYSSEDILEYIEEYHVQCQEMTSHAKYTREEVQLMIRIVKGSPKLAYRVTFRVEDASGRISKPVYIVDANDKSIINSREMVSAYDYSAIGGNTRTNPYYWNSSSSYTDGVCSCAVTYPYLDVTYDGSDYITYENEKIKVYSKATGDYIPFSFHAVDGPQDSNIAPGAYSPASDALGSVEVVYDMFENWYGMEPIDGVSETNKLKVYVHYDPWWDTIQKKWALAGWGGDYDIYFSNGNSTDYFPLTSVNPVGHEIGHGLTQTYGGNPEWYTSLGGLEEAFCDMTGETAEYYLYGQCDFKTGSRIKRVPPYYHRNMMDPREECRAANTCDNATSPMDNIAQYVGPYQGGPELDCHNVAGIFNKAFYHLASNSTMYYNVQKAYEVMLTANIYFWDSIDINCEYNDFDWMEPYDVLHYPYGCFYDAAKGAVDAAYSLGVGHSGLAVKAAFYEVGIDLLDHPSSHNNCTTIWLGNQFYVLPLNR